MFGSNTIVFVPFPIGFNTDNIKSIIFDKLRKQFVTRNPLSLIKTPFSSNIFHNIIAKINLMFPFKADEQMTRRLPILVPSGY